MMDHVPGYRPHSDLKQVTQTASEKPRRSGYLPTLDGWRAVAILAVLVDHDEPWPFHNATAYWHPYGGVGVYLFFAISGFLVCTRILEDENFLGYFNVKNFYIRRFFRIQPTALIYLGTVFLLTIFGVVHESRPNFFGSLFLYQNYLFNSTDRNIAPWIFTGHFWSLAVEEHFYLILSLLLLLWRKNRAIIFSCALACLYFWDLFGEQIHHYAPGAGIRNTEFQLEYLLFAALLAVLVRKQFIRDFIIRFIKPWTVLILAIISRSISLAIQPLPPGTHPNLFIFLVSPPTILNYSFSFFVVATVFHPRSWTGRILEWKPLRFIGRISYSLYLWHVFFFAASIPEANVHTRWLLALNQRPWRYVAALAAACISYYWIEKPCIRLGHYMAPPATPGHVDIETSAIREAELQQDRQLGLQ
jgi:peptidoglycan/LPS O-acetylase OafA/YrhL